MITTRFHGTLPYRWVRPALMAGVLAAVGSGCVLYEEEPAPASCFDIAAPALSITVLDADTQAPVPATVVVIDDAYVSELGPEASVNGVYQAAYERAGTYDIEVRSDGYAPERIEDVVVAEDTCHVITEELVVSLIPDEIGCPDVVMPGLVITVVGAETGTPILATVRVTDGPYVEEVPEEPSDGKYYAAWERAGVYDIEVSSAGYAPVTIEDVEVTEGPCNVVTKEIDVSLERT